jgi:hypothetical protein
VAEPLLLMTLLGAKHFICDFPLQAHPYQYRNKGTYGHPGGLLHSGIHGLATWWILAWFVDPMYALFLAALDSGVHYHVDWAKMNLNAKLGLKPDNSEWFWILLGLDQLLHFLTYIAIVAMVV